MGGGTPTRLDADCLMRLTTLIRRWLILAPGGEWTVEANPGTLDAEKADVLAEAGVGRVSLGAQSFHADLLRVLERRSRSMARGAGPRDRTSPLCPLVARPDFRRARLDHRHWRTDLEIALGLRPAHLSCYGLVFEKGTALWNQRQSGRVMPVDEETERTMYEWTIDRLAAAGLEMYEISNFAVPRPRVPAQSRLLGQRRVFRIRRRGRTLSPRSSLGQYARH